MKKYFLFFIACALYFITVAQQPSYKNKNFSPEARVKDLLGRMTLDEKVMQTNCLWIQKFTVLDNSGDFDEAKAIPVLKNGLGEFARLNENGEANSYGYSRKGAEVVQIYIRDDYSPARRPVKELKGFKKIWLDPGQSQTVTFTITSELLSFYDKI